jgi:hypothetical protein
MGRKAVLARWAVWWAVRAAVTGRSAPSFPPPPRSSSASLKPFDPLLCDRRSDADHPRLDLGHRGGQVFHPSGVWIINERSCIRTQTGRWWAAPSRSRAASNRWPFHAIFATTSAIMSAGTSLEAAATFSRSWLAAATPFGGNCGQALPPEARARRCGRARQD